MKTPTKAPTKLRAHADAEVERLAKIGAKRISSGARANGPGKGDGWGGPAKGAHDPIPRADPETSLTPGCDAEKRHSERVRDRAERVRLMEDKLFDLTMTAAREETQITAATALHAIYEGRPVQRNVNMEVDDVARLSDREVFDQFADVARKIAEAGERGSSPQLSPGPTDVVQ